jgi:imidazolonepropionase-like amidohydrolase
VAKIETVRSQGQKALEILAKAGVKMALGTDLLGESHRHQSDEGGHLDQRTHHTCECLRAC